MKYNIHEDLHLIMDILNISLETLSEQLGIDRLSLTRIANNEVIPSEEKIKVIYDFAYKNGIKLNDIKETLYKEESPNLKIIFHGAKTIIEGPISLEHSRTNNDFGRGFYCGESSKQAISFVSRFPNPSLYILSFDNKGLKGVTFTVNQEWMLAIAYFRGKLNDYKYHPLIQKILKKLDGADYICAPIADNRMFTIIDQFIDGLITDEQCKHSLAATDLGNQYVFITDKALQKVNVLEMCYISSLEMKDYQEIRIASTLDGENRVKAAMIKYKREGKYIEEILG